MFGGALEFLCWGVGRFVGVGEGGGAGGVGFWTGSWGPGSLWVLAWSCSGS